MFEVDVKNVMEGRGGDQARFFMWIISWDSTEAVFLEYLIKYNKIKLNITIKSLLSKVTQSHKYEPTLRPS